MSSSLTFVDCQASTSDMFLDKGLAKQPTQASLCGSEESTAASDGESPKTACASDGDLLSRHGDEDEAGREFREWAQGQLQAGEFERRALIDALEGQVLSLAFHGYGSRVLQDALDAGTAGDCRVLACELGGSVRAAVCSSHASHVMDKLVQLLPPDAIDPVLAELVDTAPLVARDRSGTRFLCKALERLAPEVASEQGPQLALLIDAILKDAAELSRHPFGHHVVEALLIYGNDLHRQRVISALRGRLARGARNRSASYVVQRALAVCAAAERDVIALEILGKPQNMSTLVRSQFGCHVVKALLSIEGLHAQRAMQQLLAARAELKEDMHSTRLFEELGI